MLAHGPWSMLLAQCVLVPLALVAANPADALARMEAEVTWRHLLARFPDPQAWGLAGAPVPNPGRMIYGLRSLPVQVSSRVPV